MAESQRLWWVIGSVALLVVVVLAGGLYWLRPQPSPAGEEVTASGAFDPYEFVRGGDASPGLLALDEAAAVGSLEPNSPDSLGLGIGEVATGVEQTAVGTSRLSDAAGEGTVSIRRPPAPAGEARPSSAAAAALPAAVERTTGAPEASGPRETATASQAREARASAAAAPSTPSIEYWIQVASFTSRARADSVDRQLRDLGVASRITTRNSGDSLFYRVRVGPYFNEREAQKFLGWIKSVDGLTGSYISRVY